MKQKYKLGENIVAGIKMKALVENQERELEIKTSIKCLHMKLFQAKENPHVDISGSSVWLKHGNNNPQSEGLYCYMQDRNMFF